MTITKSITKRYCKETPIISNPILAIATVGVPIDVGVNFAYYYDSEHLKTEIEKAVQ